MKSLGERNRAAVGAITVLLLVTSVLAALNADRLPLIGGGTTYAAYFAESAGLVPDNEVQIAGVRAGSVSSVELDGARVRVEFLLDGPAEGELPHLGTETTASIQIKTLLGEKYVALTPRGEGTLDPGEPIRLERTTTPFQLQDAFNQLGTTMSDVDTKQLADSFDVITEALSGAPKHVRGALDGLSALSQTVAERDGELARLLDNTNRVSKLVADRNDRLRKVIHDGGALLGELQARKQAISNLLAGTREVAKQLSGLVADNRAHLTPALRKLDTVTGVLQSNVDNIDRSLELLAPFTRLGANATGNGRWFEGFLCGLFPPTITTKGLTINPQGCERPVSAPGQGIGGN
ncbi:MAG: MCE family protein [Actinophytocola sp.]|nr:MCE family protein [Actinophytocola sp.]